MHGSSAPSTGISSMVKVFAATKPGMPCDDLVAALHSHPEIDLVGVGVNGRETVDAIRSSSLDALLFGEEFADLARTIRLSADIPLNSSPTMVLAADDISKPIIVRSIACGFDGVVSMSDHVSSTAERLVNIVNGGHRLVDEPFLGQLNYTPGLLVRSLVTSGTIEAGVMDLVGAGLDDVAIPETLGMSIQQVRNSIENLLHANGLASRTHLAVARASHIVIPDFA